MTIGFIGLGHMGNPMVCNLLAHDHVVHVFDLDQAAMARCVAKGAQQADSVASLAESADVIFTMLQTGEQVGSVCLGEQGIFQHASAGTLYIDTSSISVEVSRELHAQARNQGIDMLDAPVSGGVAGAEAAALTIMVGGDETGFQRAQALLGELGKNVIHAGAAGSGQAAKICNNMLLGISMIGVAEAFTLANKLGLAPEKLFEISSRASGQCWSMTSYCPWPGLVDNVPSNNDYQPGFSAQMMLKDLRLSQEAAQQVHANTPLAHEATATYAQFVAQGNADIDFSAIIKMLQQA